MAKPDYFLIVDTETTMDDKVADFGAVVVNRKGEIMAQIAVLVFGIYNDAEKHPLFWNEESGELWAKRNLAKRYESYNAMLNGGTRMLSAVSAINRWLDGVKAKYNPYLTAYNIAFDLGKCANTGIDLTMYADRKFCLWYASVEKWAFTKKYQNFVLQVNAINKPTRPTEHFPAGNCSYKTNAETMTRFVTNQPYLEDEPHTALEDVLYYELPILKKLVKTQKKDKWLKPASFNWRDVQLRNHFISN